MIRHALALEAKRAHPDRARRRGDGGDCLDGLRIRPRVSDRAVAGNASGQAVPFRERERLEAFFDPLVGVAEALLQPEHFLAYDLKAEMPRFDDPGVHGPDRNLVHAVAGDAHEGIILLTGLPFWRGDEVSPQRKLVDRPRGLPGPRPLIVGVALHADEIEGRALHAVGGREDRREVGIACAAVGQRVLQQRQTIAVFQQYAQTEAALPVAFVARPQGDELPALLPGEPARGNELARADGTTLRRDIAGERRGGDAERRNVHYPMSFAAWRYQSARNGGIHKPSIRTRPRWTNTGTIAGRYGRRSAVDFPNTIGCTLEKNAAHA